MARRTYKKISSYLSYKYFSRVNREKWKDEYKERTGRESARGWQFSPEFKKFYDSERNRIRTYAERNPEQFFEKKDTILKRSVLDDVQKYVFSDSPTPGAQLLNPMKGGDSFGPKRVVEATENKAFFEGKQLTKVIRINAPDELGGTRIATTMQEVESIRGELMRAYGANVAANNPKGSYGLIGADYSVEYHSTGNNLLAVIDIDMFLY